MTIHVISPGSDWQPCDIVILNYEQVAKYRSCIDRVAWDLLIADECHYLKNGKAARTQAVIGKWADIPADRVPPINATRKLWMTGTPVLNRPKELWVAVRTLDRNGLGQDWYGFHTRYCAAYKDVYGWQLNGNSNLDELQDRLRNGIMVRRKKADVLKELPAKRRQVFLLPAESADTKKMLELEKELAPVKQKLDKLRAEVEALSVNQADFTYKKAVQLLEKAEGVAFSDTARVRHQTALAKLPGAIDHFANVLESESKIVVFAHHHDVIDGLMAGLADYSPVKIDGRDAPGDRQKAVEAFQGNPGTRVIVGSIGAMGVGLTLTAASYCGFVELDWVPGNMAQAEDRLHRIGQAESVLVQHIMLDGSFDGYMAATVVAKLQVIERAVG
jgi:SWI/SNF-related matrix-associated actin-dependent regulator 1 of chromatin subfamily A